MTIIERDVVLQSVDEAGRPTMDFPVTKLANVEDTAEIKAEPEEGDYLPIIDGADSGQMKKVPVKALMKGGGFIAQASAPEDTSLLWIDTDPSAGGLKYYNGSAWVHVPVAYT